MLTVELRPSLKDGALMKERLAVIRDQDDSFPLDYRSCVVLKPWGFEFQMFDDRQHAVWLLCIKPGEATSLHCHQHKTAVFVPLKGAVVVKTLEQDHPLGDAMICHPCVFHSLANETEDDIYVLEIESPSIKRDLIRASDKYDRQDIGYEGNMHIVRQDLERFGYVHFGEDEVVECFGVQIIVTPAGFSIRRKVENA